MKPLTPPGVFQRMYFYMITKNVSQKGGEEERDVKKEDNIQGVMMSVKKIERERKRK